MRFAFEISVMKPQPDSQYRINACMLCRMGKLLVGLRPLTVGLRLLSIDGGGTLGVVAIGFMDVLQSILGDIWRIQDLFDVAYGTSVGGFDDPTLAFALADMGTGGLIVLILFLRQLPVSECVKMFDTLAKQPFPPSPDRTSLLSRLRRVLRSWYRNGYHDAETLEFCSTSRRRSIVPRLQREGRCAPRR